MWVMVKSFVTYIDVSGHRSKIKCRSSPSPTDSWENLAESNIFSSKEVKNMWAKPFFTKQKNYSSSNQRIKWYKTFYKSTMSWWEKRTIPKNICKTMQEKTVVWVHWFQLQDSTGTAAQFFSLILTAQTMIRN